MQSEQSVQAEFIYWNKPDPPSTAEVYSCYNGTNPGLVRCTANVSDMRPSLDSFDHSKNGFEVMKHQLPSSCENLDYLDRSNVVARYCPDLVAAIKSQLGARSVAVINNVVRQSSDEEYGDADHAQKLRQPSAGQSRTASKAVHMVHNDYSTVGARNMLRAVLPSFFEEIGTAVGVDAEDQKTFFSLRRQVIEAEDKAVKEAEKEKYSEWDGTRYNGPRWAIFSVWRPLKTVTRDPLGILDANAMFSLPSTFEEKHRSYVSPHIHHAGRSGLGDYGGDTVMPLAPKKGRQHQWHWIREQKADEVLLIKLFDSEAWLEGSMVMPFSAHSAFSIPEAPNSAPRNSIETRVFVMW